MSDIEKDLGGVIKWAFLAGACFGSIFTLFGVALAIALA